MPSKPQRIDVEEILKARPARQPKETPDGVWLFPERVARIAQAQGIDRLQLATLAHTTPGTITRWFQWGAQGGLKAPLVCWLEEELGLPPGTLLGSPKWRNQGGKGTDVIAVTEMATRLGLDKSVIAELTGGGKMSSEMDQLGVELKRAVLGAVHLLGHPLEVAVPAAHKALAKTGPAGETLGAEAWLGVMREFLPPRPASGTFPSSGKIKLG